MILSSHITIYNIFHCYGKHVAVFAVAVAPGDIIQLFHAYLVNSQNYATRGRGQLKVLLPEAVRPRAIMH